MRSSFPEHAPQLADDPRALVQDASNGDPVALDELFRRYVPELQAFVRLHMGPTLAQRESSADLVQSACREVLADLGALEWRGERAFKQRLFLEAKRKLLSKGRFHGQQRRDARRDRALHDEDLHAATCSLLTPSRVAMGREEMDLFVRSIERLPDEQRRVLLLCRGLGMTPSEAAAELGKTANAVRVTLHRALARYAKLRLPAADGGAAKPPAG